MTPEEFRESVAKAIDIKASEEDSLSKGWDCDVAAIRSEAFDEAAAIVRAHPIASPWIAVAERLPKNGEDTLIALRSRVYECRWVQGVFDASDNTWMTEWGEWSMPEVTSWMEVPEPPEPTP